jgi:hypothetical protein
MTPVDENYSHMAARCVLLAADTTDEQHKSVLLRTAAKLNKLPPPENLWAIQALADSTSVWLLYFVVEAVGMWATLLRCPHAIA